MISKEKSSPDFKVLQHWFIYTQILWKYLCVLLENTSWIRFCPSRRIYKCTSTNKYLTGPIPGPQTWTPGVVTGDTENKSCTKYLIKAF